jgi:hypothetical protein
LKIIFFLIAVFCFNVFSLDSFTVAKTYTDADTLYASDLNKNPDSIAAWSGRLVDSINIKFARLTSSGKKITIDSTDVTYLGVDTCLGFTMTNTNSGIAGSSGYIVFTTSGAVDMRIGTNGVCIGKEQDPDSLLYITKMYESGGLVIKLSNGNTYKIPTTP